MVAMSLLKRFFLAVVLAAFAVGSARAQTPLVLIDAELALSFGSVKGQVAFVGSHILFVSAETPKSSLSIDRADIARMERSGDVTTVTTRRSLRDAEGSRDTFRFRPSDPAVLMRWYEAVPAAPAVSAAPAAASPSAPIVTPAVLASYQVKHDHKIGSCQGTLMLTADAVSFESLDRIEDARQWKLIDIKKVEQNGIYKLKVEPFQGDAFNFELNGKGIDSGEFRQLVDRIARARAVR
jgi:hypothetical protein